jgi:MscS family membrane protein
MQIMLPVAGGQLRSDIMWDVSEKLDLALRQAASWFDNLDMDRLLSIATLIGLAVLLRRPLAAAFTAIIVWLLSAIRIKLSDDVRAEIKGSATTLVVVLAVLVSLHVLSPPAMADSVLQRIVSTFIVLGIYSVLYRRSDLIIATLSPDGGTKAGADTNWMVRLFRLAVAVMAFATVTDVWGLSISGALTGVGVLGAGLAIAAQDFVNNISERRFRPGDWIKVENGVEGTVVSMDLRSTTVMGFDRVPRYVPNSNLANAVLQNFNRMDHRQINWTFGIALSAEDEQVEAICADLRRYVEESGEYVTDGRLLCFVVPVGLSESAIEITIYVFAKTVSYQTYLEVCGRLTLALRAAVVRAGTKLAYPTRTVILENTEVMDAHSSERTTRGSSSSSPKDDKTIGNDNC